MSSVERIKQGRYTEADVLALYMKYREAGIGPFIREVGDFIAHSKRDRGATLDTTAYMFAQLAFFQTYQSDRKRPLEAKGVCGWWLRHYLLTKANEATDRDIHLATGFTKRRAKNAIKSWFPEKSVYPTVIKCGDPALLHRLAEVFCRTINGKPVFDRAGAKLELETMFGHEGIKKNEIDRFLVGTSILLKDKSVEIVPGFSAHIRLSVDKERYIPVDEYGNETDDKKAKFVRPLPHGNLKIAVSTRNQTGDDLIDVGLDFLDTAVDTEAYFSRSLVSLDTHRLPRLNLDQQLSFDTNVLPPVYA
ncbi:hypothetical protein ACQKH5_18670 [Hyphomonas sp. NPDC076900]|uniref:hypothetical protein n=1 Tax=unclassified Hyphomonas TaxID=2630699 RepID=UPI003D09082D